MVLYQFEKKNSKNQIYLSGSGNGQVVRQAVRDIVDRGGDIELLPDLGGDLVAGVHYRGVMLAAEHLADIGVGDIGQRPAKIHGNVAGDGDPLIAAGGNELVHGHVEIIRGDLLYKLRRDHVLAFGGDVVLQDGLDKASVDGAAL